MSQSLSTTHVEFMSGVRREIRFFLYSACYSLSHRVIFLLKPHTRPLLRQQQHPHTPRRCTALLCSRSTTQPQSEPRLEIQRCLITLHTLNSSKHDRKEKKKDHLYHVTLHLNKARGKDTNDHFSFALRSDPLYYYSHFIKVHFYSK